MTNLCGKPTVVAGSCSENGATIGIKIDDYVYTIDRYDALKLIRNIYNALEGAREINKAAIASARVPTFLDKRELEIGDIVVVLRESSNYTPDAIRTVTKKPWAVGFSSLTEAEATDAHVFPESMWRIELSGEPGCVCLMQVVGIITAKFMEDRA